MKKIAIYIGIPALIVSGIALIYFRGAQLGPVGAMANFMYPGIVSDESFKQAIMHPESSDAYSAYSILATRHSDVAHQIALKDLTSSDPYLWLNAAEYLGAIGDNASVPYLIKALRHTAWREDDETKQRLVSLTGTNLYTFNGWQQWWIASHPGGHFDWDNNLGFRPRISTVAATNGN